MPRSCLFLVLLLFNPTLFHGQQDTEALWRNWKDRSGSDTVRLEALHTLAKEVFLYTDPDSAFHLAELELQEAKRVGNVHYEGEALNTQGIAMAVRGRMDQAMRYFERSLAVFEAGHDSIGMSGALYNIGSFHLRTGRSEEGLAIMQRSLTISERTGNVRSMTHCYHGIGRYYEQRGEYDEALRYYTRSRDTFLASADDRGVISSLISMGIVHKSRGDYDRAIATLGEALDLAEAIDDRGNIGNCLDNIGNILARQGDHEQALEHYQRALVHAQEVGDEQGVMHSLINVGNAYLDLHLLPEAIATLQRALGLARDLDDTRTEAIVLNNLCSVYGEMGELEQALDHCQRGLALKRRTGFTKGISNSLANIGAVLVGAGRYREALPYSEEALILAREAGNGPEMRDAAHDLAIIHKALGRPARALAMYELFVQMKDSIDREENQRAVLRQEYNYAYQKQALADSLEFARQAEVKDLELQRQEADIAKQRIALFSAGGGLLLLLSLAFSVHRGKQRSDELLHNILPVQVAAELKRTGGSQARQIDQVTVLFTDFKGFTAISEKLGPKELVKDLHECFSAFDRIMERYGIEKIKTIGDAYMAAGGLPTPNSTHAADVVRAALEIRDFMAYGKAEKEATGLPFFEVRIGIHTGPVVAGIVGVKKFAYDIWGDTVNTASRMESSGAAGAVNISGSTYAMVKHEADLRFIPRGKVQAKGKGAMEMFFVETVS